MSVLSQALGGASHRHKLEFAVKSTEELNAVVEELKACDRGTTLQHSVSRSSTYLHKPTRVQGYNYSYYRAI